MTAFSPESAAFSEFSHDVQVRSLITRDGFFESESILELTDAVQAQGGVLRISVHPLFHVKDQLPDDTSDSLAKKYKQFLWSEMQSLKETQNPILVLQSVPMMPLSYDPIRKRMVFPKTGIDVSNVYRPVFEWLKAFVVHKNIFVLPTQMDSPAPFIHRYFGSTDEASMTAFVSMLHDVCGVRTVELSGAQLSGYVSGHTDPIFSQKSDVLYSIDPRIGNTVEKVHKKHVIVDQRYAECDSSDVDRFNAFRNYLVGGCVALMEQALQDEQIQVKLLPQTFPLRLSAVEFVEVYASKRGKKIVKCIEPEL